MSQLLPKKPEDYQEEPLEPMFERNQEYKETKKSGVQNLIQKYYKPISFVEKFQNLFQNYRFSFVAGFTSVAVIVGLIVALVLLPNSPLNKGQIAKVFNGINVDASEVELQPTDQDITGVQAGSDYVLETKKAVTLEQVKNNLKISPSADFQVEKLNDTKYKIKFASPLTKNQIYKFQLQATPDINQPANKLDLSWAFQVKDNFRVVQTLPRDKTSNVPVNTGIEIVFNNEAYQNPESLFSISPKVEGKFERRGQAFTFIPKELKKSTLYTVNLKAGLGLNGSDQKTAEDTKFQFETQGDLVQGEFDFIKVFSEFSTKDKPTFEMIGTGEIKKFDLNIFSYQNVESFIQDVQPKLDRPSWTTFNNNSTTVNSSKLTKVLSQKITTSQDSSNFYSYFEINKTLPAGYYLIETKLGNKTLQNLFQVTDLAAYFEETEAKTLLWAVDLSTQKPASGATIKTSTGQSLQTDTQGIAFFDTDTKNIQKNGYFLITSGDKKIFLPKFNLDQIFRSSINGDNNYIGDRYWSYIYQDKPYYKPTDTINFWGYLQDRVTKSSPTKLKAFLLAEDYSGEGYKQIEIQKIDLNIQNNVFQSQFKFNNLNSGNYSLIIKNDQDQTLQQSFVRIDDVKKPSYTINLEPEKKAYFAGEKVVYNGEVKFFEGTPVANLDLIRGIPGGDQKLKTDSQGKFQISYTLPSSTDSDRTFQYTDRVNVYAQNVENAEISADAQVRVFNYKTVVESESKIEANKAKVDLQLNEVDLSKLNNGTEQNESDYVGKPVSNKNFQIKLSENEYQKVEGESRYNLVTKKTEKSYYYNYSQFPKELPAINLKTKEDGKVSFEFNAKSENQYQIFPVEVTGSNSSSPISNISTLYNRLSIPQNDSANYTLNISPNKEKYDIGDKISLKFQKDQKNLGGKNNLYLLSFAQLSLQSYKIQDNPEFNFDFSSDFVPNVLIGSLYFDGRNINSIYNQNLVFNYDVKKLNIEVKTDKASYKPGENVQIEATIKDQKGNAISTNLNLSVVDEAIFGTQPTELDTLKHLYQQIFLRNDTSYLSHRFNCEFNCGGRGDGGDGVTPRKDFKDNAYFQNITTDSSGQAKTSFKLPDDLTSWRISFQAISSDLQAGSGFKNVTTKLPFFVDPVIGETYLSGDKPIFKLRAFGTELKDQEVQYTVNSESLGIKDQIIKGKGSLDLKLDVLKPGKYKISVNGKAGDLQDTVIKEIEVLSSYTTQTKTNFIKFSPDSKLTGSQTGATTLTFSDEGRAKYYQKLIELVNNYGDRVDQVLARNLAKDTLKNNFQESLATENIDLKTYQNESGGIGIYSYAGSDLELSAQIASLSSGQFNSQTLKNYFNNILISSKENRDRKIIALYGLAVLDEPVLNQANFLKKQTDLTPKEQIYLGLILTKLGDKESARKIYKTLLEKYKEDQSETSKINIGNSEEVSINTSLISVLAAQLEEKEAPRFFDYVQNNYPKENLVYLNEINFLNSWIGRVNSSEVEFSYSLNEQKTNKKLAAQENFALQVSPAELDKLKIEVTKGSLGILSSYQIPFESKNKDENVEISRGYFINGKKTNNFKEGDTVKVTLDFNLKDKASDGCYQISDYLPSGLKPLTSVSYSRANNDPDVQLPYNLNGQKVSFCVDKKSKKPLSYLARVTGKGEFSADKAIIQSTKNTQSLNYTGTENLKIN